MLKQEVGPQVAYPAITNLLQGILPRSEVRQLGLQILPLRGIMKFRFGILTIIILQPMSNTRSITMEEVRMLIWIKHKMETDGFRWELLILQMAPEEV